MERYNDGRSAGITGLTAFVLCVSMFNIGSAVGRSLEHADDRVHDVQISNSQLHDQLARDHQVGQLVLNDEEHTFSFHTEDPTTEQPETCTGKYEVKNEVAELVGPLSCTQVIPAPAHS